MDGCYVPYIDERLLENHIVPLGHLRNFLLRKETYHDASALGA